MLDVLFSGVLGGVLRLAPEILKFFDKKNERQHELSMLDKEMEFAKVKGEISMRQVEATMLQSELETIGKAFDEQSKTSASAGWFISAISALVRPIITYLFVSAYFAVKFATFSMAMSQGGSWQEVIVKLWTADDVNIMFMIISFWFVGRVWDKQKK